jgi:hypothetical protein
MFLLIPVAIAITCLVGGTWLLLRGAREQPQPLEFDNVSRLDAYRQLLAPAHDEIRERAKRQR